MIRPIACCFVLLAVLTRPGFGDNLASHYDSQIRQDLILADSFHLIENDSGVHYALKALSLASKTNNEVLMAESMLRLGYALSYKGDHDSSIQVLKEAKILFHQQEDFLNEARCMNALGLASYGKGEYRRAMEEFLSALKIFESTDDKDGLAAVYVNLSGIYELLGDNELDLNYSKRAARVYKTLNNQKQYAVCLNNIAHAYNNMGQYTMAIKYLKKSIRIKNDIGATSSLAYSYATLYESYRLKNDLVTGKKYLDLAFDIFTKEGNLEGIIETNSLLANFYFRQKKYSDALDHALTGFMLAKNSGHRKAQMDLSNDLSKYYLSIGSREKAADFETRHLLLKDSLLNATVGEEIINAQVAYELNKKRYNLRMEEDDAEKDNSMLGRSNNLVNVISIVVIVLLAIVQVIAIFYYVSQRKRPKFDKT